MPGFGRLSGTYAQVRSAVQAAFLSFRSWRSILAFRKKSGRPLVWSSSWRTVIFGFMSNAGSRGATFWSSESFPSSTSWSTTAAVAVFDTDASAKAVPVVMGSAAATSRMPEAPSHRRPSSQRIATDTPGICSFLRSVSSRAWSALAGMPSGGHDRG